MKSKQPTLFDLDPLWKEEWDGMPEFVQEGKSEHQKLIIRFESKEDVEAFAALIDQPITDKTKSIWFPFKSHWREGPKQVWVDEDES